MKTGNTRYGVLPEGNLSYYDREKQRTETHAEGQQQSEVCFSVRSSAFYTLDNQGNCWLTSTRGIYKLSFFPHTYNLVHIDNGFETRAFLCDNEKRLWVSSKAQMIRVYQPDGQLEGYLTPQGKISKDKQSFYKRILLSFEDHEGNILDRNKGKRHLSVKEKVAGFPIPYNNSLINRICHTA